MPFPPEACEKLGYYVYAYLDPRDQSVFYVGKGKGNRAFEHLYDTSETKKVARIAEINSAGLLPRIDILVHGLTEPEALRVEAVCIDLIGLDRLTNLVTGHGAAWGGRQPVEQIIEQYTATPAQVTDPAIGITINRTFFYGMSDQALYEATRGIWVISRQRAVLARYALAVYHGVVKEVFQIGTWHPAGSTRYQTRKFDREDFEGRSEFVGERAPEEIRERYVGKRVTEGNNQNPIRYFNC